MLEGTHVMSVEHSWNVKGLMENYWSKPNEAKLKEVEICGAPNVKKDMRRKGCK